MYSIILVIHVIACIGLILIVLLQTGKSGGMAGLFGGGGADQVFSAPSGTAFIKKATAIMAVVFVCSSLLLTILTSRKGFNSVTNQLPPMAAPAAPAAAPAPLTPSPAAK